MFGNGSMRRFACLEAVPLLLDASAGIGLAVLEVRRRLFGVVNGFKRSGP
jgi:hypothetical protein